MVDNADVLLPIAPFTETAGTFVNAEGRVQSVHGVVKPLGEARPAWKVLRVLGNLLGLAGFRLRDHRRRADRGAGRRRDAGLAAGQPQRRGLHRRLGAAPALQRIADVPIYATDMLVRRAASLQLTADARAPVASLPSTLWRQLGLAPGAKVLRRPGAGRRAAAGARGRDACRGRRARAGRSPGDRRARRDVRADHRREGLSHARHRQPIRQRPARRYALARRLEPDQDRRAGAAADDLRRLPDAVGAQGHRLHADPPRPQSRRPVRPAAADRRRGEADLQGDHPPDRGEQAAVLPRPGDDDHAGAGGLGGGALRPRRRARQRQRRPAVPDGDHLDGGLRRDHRRLGQQLEVRFPRRAARVGADGQLRDRDGLRARRRADGLGQHEHERHRHAAGARNLRRDGRGRAVVELAAAAADLRRLLHLGPGRDEPRIRSTSSRANRRSSPAT